MGTWRRREDSILAKRRQLCILNSEQVRDGKLDAVAGWFGRVLRSNENAGGADEGLEF